MATVAARRVVWPSDVDTNFSQTYPIRASRDKCEIYNGFSIASTRRSGKKPTFASQSLAPHDTMIGGRLPSP